MTTGGASCVPVAAAGRDRRTILLAGEEPHVSDGLEIGPSLNPLVPKADGARIRSVDHADAETLRAKYATHVGADVSRIEDVDYVWAGGRLRDAVHDGARFDYVVASHALEHLPNPVAFLQDVAGLLRPGGHLALALPDHRFCFDHARPLTTFGAWLDAFEADRERHTAGTVVDHLLYAVARGGAIMWTAHEQADVTLVHRYDDALTGHRDAHDPTAEYQDVHAWVLNPSSFALLIDGARRFGLLDLELAELVDTVDGEFFAILRRAGVHAAPPDDAARLATMLAVRDTERAPIGPPVVPARLRWRRVAGRVARRAGLRRPTTSVADLPRRSDVPRAR